MVTKRAGRGGGIWRQKRSANENKNQDAAAENAGGRISGKVRASAVWSAVAIFICAAAAALGGCGESNLTFSGPVPSSEICVPGTCTSLGAACGQIADGCGGKLDCGSCEDIDPGTCTAMTCASRGFECGTYDDGCGGTISCGSCELPKTCAGGGRDGRCGCAPQSCDELGVDCGVVEDECGNTVNCGSCIPQCTPATCASLGATCGTYDDGCGGTLNCGECPPVCTPTTCAAQGKNCGTLADGCGGTLNCGSCSGSNQTCSNNVCVTTCTPTTCAAQGKNCGSISDGCGGTLNCGSCSGSNQTCSNNVCVTTCTPKTCASLGYNCGTASDGCGGTLSCGGCGGGQTCSSNHCTSTALPYPTRPTVKGLQPDFWGNIDEISGNAVHGVAMNLVWAFWETNLVAPVNGVCSNGGVAYQGHCFVVDQGNANAIKAYSDRGVVVTGIVYGVPAWARRSGCPAPPQISADYFCAPTEAGAADYGRFAGFLAWYFNGLNGHGRVADFVIHNEVNSSAWFNPGCTKSGCKNMMDTWVKAYAQSYNAAYDAVMKEQPYAKVLFSFEHHFGSTYDSHISDSNQPYFSAETFLTKLIPQVGTRDWRIAWHAYPPNLLKPVFGANDYPQITFGNIGVLEGWLRKNYPNDPHAWEIQLTENGINGVTGNASMQTQQNTYLCKAFEAVNGTPGVESLIYHRMLDHSTETAAGLGCGLRNSDTSAKPAWTTYALSNQNGHLNCGFQYIVGQSEPKTHLIRGSKGGKHWATTRILPSGYAQDGVNWLLLRNPKSGTHMLYECCLGNGTTCDHSFVSTAANCEGQFPMGPMGYAYDSQVSGTVPLYRCYSSKTNDHMISGAANCEGYTIENNGAPLGYVYPN